MNKVILVSSGYGLNTRLPFVQIESEDLDKPIQVSPQEARDLALNLLQAAEGADTDAFMVDFLKNTVGFGDSEIAQMVALFRAERIKNRNG